MLPRPISSSTPDHRLLLRTHRGDDRAARELWSRFGPRLVAYAGALLRSASGGVGGEDAVQAAFCRILETERGELRKVRDVAGWLTTLTRHAALNLKRTEQRERLRRAAVEEQGRATPDDSGPAGDELLRAGLDGLDEDLREIILLKHAAGLTFDQIAAVLELNRSTINSRYRKALEELRSPRTGRGGAARPTFHAGVA